MLLINVKFAWFVLFQVANLRNRFPEHEVSRTVGCKQVRLLCNAAAYFQNFTQFRLPNDRDKRYSCFKSTIHYT